MKNTNFNFQRNRLFVGGIMLIGLLLATSLHAHGTDSGGAITKEELTTNGYTVPTDLVAGATPTQLANYAWRLFIANMQNTDATLQNGTTRGTPSSTSNFIDSGGSTPSANPLVFESLYHRTEAFPYYTSNNKPASPLGKTPVYYTYYFDENGAQVAYTPPATSTQYVNLDETNQIGQNFLYYRNSNDPDFPVLFMAKVNATETSYVWDKQPPSSDNSFDFPDTVLEVKTAWRRMSDLKNTDANDYHQATATYYKAGTDGVPHPVTETFVLIGIHIIQKTANYPHFIFTTFEHVDAAIRDANGVITDPAYQLTYDGLAYNGDGATYSATALGAYDDNAPGQSGASDTKTTYQLPPAGPTNLGPHSANYQTVVQPKTITSEVNDVNNSVYKLITSLDSKSVWKNYRLKGVQGAPNSDQTNDNYYLANIVIESSQPGIQLFTGTLVNGGVPLCEPSGTSPDENSNCPTGETLTLTNNRSIDGSYTGGNPPYGNVSESASEGGKVKDPIYTVGGCQGCHGAAQQKGRDFSFLAQASGGKGKEIDTVPAAALTPAAVKLLRAKTVKTNNFND